MNLHELQKMFMEFITHPEFIEKNKIDVNLSEIFPGSPRVSGIDQIKIYSGMYESRIIDAIAPEYPVSEALCGKEKFNLFLKDYIKENPSHSYTLNDVSLQIHEFIKSHPLSHEIPPLSDAILFEKNIYEKFFCAEEKPLRLEELQKIPQEKWPDLIFVPRKNVCLLKVQYPVHEWRAKIDAQEWKSINWENTFPESLNILIHRRDLMIRYRKLEKNEAILLKTLQQQLHFSEVCEKSMQTWLKGSAEPAAAILHLIAGFLEEQLIVLKSESPADFPL